MTGKERVQRALNHQEGQVPIAFGGGPTTGIHCRLVERLRNYYGLEQHPITVIEPYQMLGLIDDDLKDAIGIDTVPLWSPGTMFGFDNVNWKEWRTPWGQDVLVAGDFNTTIDANGDVLIYPEGDLSVPPSGRMPVGGDFFDSIIRQEPIDDNHLNVEDNLEEFGQIKEKTLQYLQTQATKLKDSTRFVFGNFGGTAIGDIALVPASSLKHPKGIRDITEWYMSTVSRQDYLHQIFTRQTDIALENLAKIYTVVGDVAGLAYVCGTDFGTQISTFCSPRTFKTLYQPYYQKVNNWIHQHTSWKTFKHSCGAVEKFMPLFIESGFDIINPVQCSATGMDPKILKERYGQQLVFWGGGVDTQHTLPFGSPEDVRAEVLSRCEVFAPNGGFVFNAIHNVLPNTPVENFIAMINAVNEFNGTRA
ncbi:uroporphyrinogen-III decarboxylase [Candidatus Moduliflexus flocculans]|uniref:Uroporphyrinogen-III decarboxylase n=1 Tax=Candidatus Moduliflexus flocculans TaxID=1499966 RepID=A0A081BRI5_9BACT|nr:uroporphyrinogen-III decarboxylase [Candidatus Moduliflexus flocculans]